jgi:hypothetical protein
MDRIASEKGENRKEPGNDNGQMRSDTREGGKFKILNYEGKRGLGGLSIAMPV